ncbi:hypothetical protein M514_00136 [Trichuris suis]|uniref:Uncharacterized protein n=1 Tax=Trichuris suis TaxID=68888 RepID=A0A085MP27_9BILA|nr:hypothetical protein M513_00136 [Trichuris suis]KFD73004.1 hypothetical protein M514_00136 [Trichuris suis]
MYLALNRGNESSAAYGESRTASEVVSIAEGNIKVGARECLHFCCVEKSAICTSYKVIIEKRVFHTKLI